jgi:protein-tyrosine phosphatase
MATLESQQVLFEACFNFRDLGGYATREGGRTRRRTLYRSDSLHRLTRSDGVVFESLAIRTIIDLRSGMEIEDHGRFPFTGRDASWHHSPMLDDLKLRLPADGETERPREERLAQNPYMYIVDEFGDSIAATFKLLAADEALPAVYHCTSGKDRTGIISALMLELLGVPDATIAADYALTEETRARSSSWISEHEPDLAAFFARIPPERSSAHPEKIVEFLGQLRTVHGSASDFLMWLGVSEEEQAALRGRLLEF